MENSFKLPGKVVWGYGAAGYAASMFFLNFSFYALYFMTDYVGLAPAVAGSIIALGSIWDAITDPTVGYISDHRDPAKGRRRPFLLLGGIPLTLFAWLSFATPKFGDTGNIIYFIVVILGAYLFQTILDIPYSALCAEMTQDYDERSRLNSARNIFWLIAMFLSSGFLFIVDFYTTHFGLEGNLGFFWASLTCSVPIGITAVISYLTTKGYELNIPYSKPEKKLDIFVQMAEPMKNKVFRYVTAVFLLSIIAQVINNSVGMYYYINVLNMSLLEISYLFLAEAAVALVFIWLVNVVSQKFSKKAAWTIFIGGWAVAAGYFALFALNPESPLIIYVFFGVTTCMGLHTQYQMIWSMIPDCVEVDEFKTGIRREGMYYGVISFIQKAGAALFIAISAGLIGMIGYDGQLTMQTPETIIGLRWLFGGGVALFCVLSIIVNLFNPMSRKAHAALLNAIKAKKNRPGILYGRF